MMAGDNSVSNVLDCLRMYLVAVVIHNEFRIRCFNSFVIYNGFGIAGAQRVNPPFEIASNMSTLARKL